jgi:hypothetical protein
MHAKIEQQLMAELSRRNIDLLTHFAEANLPAVDVLVGLVLSHRPKLAERASWVLEKLSERNPGLLNASLPRLIDNLKQIPSSSTRRTLAKVLSLHTLPEAYEGAVLDFCLTMLEDPKEPVAVKANCMSLVFQLLPKYPELKNELFLLIEDQLPYQSVGFASRYKVLQKKYRGLLR